jgi:programmed cell death protein 5
MDDLEEIKQRKLKELLAKQEEALKREQERRLAELQLEAFLRKHLTTKAKERLSNVKLVNQQLYWTAVQNIILMIQRGMLKTPVDEVKVKQVLAALSKKRSIKIKRK